MPLRALQSAAAQGASHNGFLPSLLGVGWGRSVAEGVPEVEDDTAKDAGVGDVEGGPMVGAEEEVEKVNDVAEAEAVDEISNYARANEAKNNLHVGGFDLQSFPVEVNGKEGADGQSREEPAVA